MSHLREIDYAISVVTRAAEAYKSANRKHEIARDQRQEDESDGFEFNSFAEYCAAHKEKELKLNNLIMSIDLLTRSHKGEV